MRDAEKTIGGMLDKQKITYIAGVDGEGFPEMRAMLAPRKRDGIKTVWFTTNTSSAKVAEYLADDKAAVYVADTRFFRGALLKGTMEVLTDGESKEMLWRIGDRLYYHGGVTDPDYCVLKFTAASGKYYANFKTESFTIGDKTENFNI
jgi:general stress protein 26